MRKTLLVLMAAALFAGSMSAGSTLAGLTPVAATAGSSSQSAALPATPGIRATSEKSQVPSSITPASLAKETAAPPAAGNGVIPPGVTEMGAPSEKTPAPVKEAAPSDIEKAINAVDRALDKAQPLPPLQMNLTQFGYNFFEAAPGFSPLVDIPVGPDYVVGPGDTIILSTWGSLEGTFPLEVNRSGEIVLPKVGAVRVWGVSFAQLPRVIETNLAKTFRNFQVNVTMGKLRLIKVYVVGAVRSPGGYDISALSTLVNVLAVAGGPTKSGTLRNIQVKRGGETAETVDLYDFFLKGDKSRDIRLQSGDTIFVPAIGKVAGIGGNVRRPAIYELKGEKTLKDLIDLADGILPTGYLQRVQITRVAAHEKKEAADLNIDPKATAESIDRLLESVAIRDMDTVKVFPIDTLLRDHVRLTGYLLRPGDYALKPGMRIGELLTRDNFLPEYYGEVAEITRFLPPDLRPGKIFFNLSKALAGDPDHNLELREFDTIRIFSRWEMEEMPKVRIGGEVQKPGEYRLFEKMTLRDLVLAAGNVKKTAFLKNAEITRVAISKEGVKSHLINVDLDEALKDNPADNVVLDHLDEVVVRRLPDWMEETDRYVTLRGEVRFPGVYPIFKGEKLSSLLLRAGGYSDKAYLKGAKFTRRLVAEIQQKRMDEVIARTEQDIAQKQQELASVAASKEELEATSVALEGLRRSLEKVRTARAEGRISIALAPIEKLQGTSFDLELMGGDALDIPQSSDAVMVVGEVYNPTTVIHVPGSKVAYYLEKAGGGTSSAEEDEIYVIRADGTVQSRQNSSSFLFYDSFMALVLDPGDAVVVPQKLEKIAWMRDIKDIAMIIGQIALAAGVIVAAGL